MAVVNYNNLVVIFSCFVTVLLASKKFACHYNNCENIKTYFLIFQPLLSIFFFFFLIDVFFFLNFLPCLFPFPPAIGILKLLGLYPLLSDTKTVLYKVPSLPRYSQDPDTWYPSIPFTPPDSDLLVPSGVE